MVQALHIHSDTPRVSKEWLGLSNEERLSRVGRIMSAVSAFEVRQTDGPEIIVTPAVWLDAPRLGPALRILEDVLRHCLGEPIEIYCVPQKDLNKPRGPRQREKIQEWVKARQALKLKKDDAQQ